MTGGWLVGGATLALLVAALFAGAGSDDARLTWIGGGAVLAAAAAVAAIALRLLPRPRLGRSGVAAVGLFTAFVVWTGISIQWSLLPDRSWAYLNRGLAYGAFLILGLVLAAVLPRAPRLVAGALAALLGVVLLWALAGKAVPALGPDEARVARLRSPVEYWNALGLLCDMALALGLWLAAARDHARAIRVAGATLAYVALVALVLTTSRGGLLVAVLVVAASVAVARDRVDAAVAIVVAAAPAAAVAAWALDRPALVEAGRERGDGLLFALVFLGGAAAVIGASLWLAARRPSPRTERVLARGAVGVAALVVVAAAAGLTLRGGEWWDEFANPPDVQLPSGPERLGAVSSNNRWGWWQEAWQALEERPATGTGAASFQLTHLRLREGNQVVTEPHNVPLQFLTELGLVGFALFLAFLVAAAFAVREAVRRADARERGAVAALGVVAAAYLAHACFDYDWDFVAVTAPALVALGAVIARPGTRADARRPLAAVGAVALAAAAVSSLFVPWLAAQRTAEAYDSAVSAPARGASAAASAEELNPLAVEHLYAWAAAEEARGNLRGALVRYTQAAERQPDNPETWRNLAIFELEVARAPERALAHFDCMYALDPFGPGGELLNEARERAQRPASCPRR